MDFSTREFLESLFDDLDSKFLIEIRELYDNSNKNFFYRSLDELLELYKPDLEKHCYFGISSRGHKKNTKGKTSGENSNCVDVKALWFDFDYITLDEVKDRIKIFDIKPSYIISSGNGYHVYYILEERIETEKVVKILRPLTKRIGADMRVATHSKILRLPGTVNKKNDSWCEIIEINRVEYPFEYFEKMVDIDEEQLTEKTIKISNAELSKIASRCQSYCISKMLSGVKKGERHAATLRLTNYFRDILKLEKSKALDLLQQWNRKNKPMEFPKEVEKNFNSIWDKDYKFLGCEFDGSEKFCKKDKCFSPIIQPKLEFENIPIKFDTKIFEKDYEKLTGYELVFLGLLQIFPDGLTFEELKDKCTTKKTGKVFLHDQTRKRVLEDLLDKKLIEQCGDLYIYSRKGQYNRAYVMISPSLLRLVMHKMITQAEFKLLVLMKKYARKEDDYIIFPTEVTLAKELGITQSVVSKHISNLEEKNYLEKMYYVKRGYDFLKYRILV